MKVKESKLLFDINLQMFNGMFDGVESTVFNDSEPVDPPPTDPPPTDTPPSDPPPTDTPPSDPPPTDTPPQDIEPPNNPPQDIPPVDTPPQEPQELEFDLVKYLDDMRNDIHSRIDNIAPQPPQEPQLSEEELAAQAEAQKEELLNTLYENPTEFVKNIQEQAKQEALQEFQNMQRQQQERIQQQMQQQQRWNNTVQEFMSKTEDAQQYVPKMLEILEQNPHLQQDKNPYELAYKMAKYDDLANQQKPKTFEEMLQDEEYRSKITQDPKVRQAVLESLKHNQTPTVISTSTGNQTVTPQNKPKSFSDASKSVLAKAGW